MYRMLVFCSIILLFSACQKDKITKPFVDLSINTDQNLHQIHFIDNENALILGGTYWDVGSLFTTFDKGQSWQIDSLTNKTCLSYSQDNLGTLFSTGPSGVVNYCSIDCQQIANWQLMSIAPFKVLTDASFYDTRGIVTHGQAFNKGKLFFVEDKIVVDTSKTLDADIQSVHMSSPDIFQAAGYGIMLYSDDFGETIESLDVDNDFYIDLFFLSPDLGYCLGQEGTVLKTTDSGKTWENIRQSKSFNTQTYTAIYFATNDIGFICGDNGILEMTTNGGQDWNDFLDIPEYNFNSMTVQDRTLFIVGDAGHLIKFNNIY